MPKPLLERCACDSIREFRAAALQRFLDAQELAASGRKTAAIYLWGYAVEMTLKAAYFRLIGFPEARPIAMIDLRSAAANGVRLGVAWPGQPGRYNLHDVEAWASLLINTRASRPALAYPVATFGGRVRSAARSLRRVWGETLRYHKNVAYDHELRRARDAASWFLRNSSRL
jgi:hypothetical protein